MVWASPVLPLEGYAFIGPGGVTVSHFTNGTLHLGGGVEKVFRQGIGVGGEIGAVGSWTNFRTAIGIASANGCYHFLRNRSKLDPFVTGGYSMGFRNNVASFLNVGGGLNYWLGERLGIRVEFREHIHVSDLPANLLYWGFRLGVSMR